MSLESYTTYHWTLDENVALLLAVRENVDSSGRPTWIDAGMTPAPTRLQTQFSNTAILFACNAVISQATAQHYNDAPAAVG